MIKIESEKEQRNEVMRAFRKFARLELANGESNPIQVYKRIDVLCHSHRTKLDMLAVFDTLRLLSLSGEEDTINALRDVYFASAKYRFSQNETSRLIRKSAQLNYCDERTIYRRLHKARELYTRIREQEGFLWDGRK